MLCHAAHSNQLQVIHCFQIIIGVQWHVNTESCQLANRMTTCLLNKNYASHHVKITIDTKY